MPLRDPSYYGRNAKYYDMRPIEERAIELLLSELDRKHITARQLAEKLDIDWFHVERQLTGKVRLPLIKIVVMLQAIGTEVMLTPTDPEA